jgi:hypothetical protein
MGLFRLTADKVAQIFGVRVTKRRRGKLHRVLENLGHHVMGIYCRNLGVVSETRENIDWVGYGEAMSESRIGAIPWSTFSA